MLVLVSKAQTLFLEDFSSSDEESSINNSSISASTKALRSLECGIMSETSFLDVFLKGSGNGALRLLLDPFGWGFFD